VSAAIPGDRPVGLVGWVPGCSGATGRAEICEGRGTSALADRRRDVVGSWLGSPFPRRNPRRAGPPVHGRQAPEVPGAGGPTGDRHPSCGRQGLPSWRPSGSARPEGSWTLAGVHDHRQDRFVLVAPGQVIPRERGLGTAWRRPGRMP